MATTRSFNSMLNEYLPYELLREETIKRNYLLTQIGKDDSWRGGNLVVPFKGGHASSFRYGALTASNNVSEDQFVRGNVANYKEIWGTMKFNARDLAEHNGGMGSAVSGQVSEQSFVRILPDTLDDFLEQFGFAMMLDVHSIASRVPRLFEDQLPDLNLLQQQLHLLLQ